MTTAESAIAAARARWAHHACYNDPECHPESHAPDKWFICDEPHVIDPLAAAIDRLAEAVLLLEAAGEVYEADGLRFYWVPTLIGIQEARAAQKARGNDA